MPVSRGQSEVEVRSVPRNERSRRPISCLPCRHRKLRCDRALPACSNCVDRNQITSCHYTSRKSDSRTAKLDQPSDLSESAQRKIDHLERVVRTLLKHHQQTQGQVAPLSWFDEDYDGNYEYEGSYPPLDLDKNQREAQKETEPSKQKISTGRSNLGPAVRIGPDYKQGHSIDEAHWALLLNEISDVREHLRVQHEQYQEQSKKVTQLLQRTSDDAGPTLLFGSARNCSRSEILAQLPSRYNCDIMITRFFTHLYPAIYIIHGPTFYKQYEDFWSDRNQTPIVWIGLLFAMLRIAMIDYIREADEPEQFRGKCQDMAICFRNHFTDCLILADYMQPHEFLIEALCLHLYAEYVSSRDAKSSIWVLIGMIVRLAMRMGYHLPVQPALTSAIFQVEMRRRTWTFIRQADIMLSFQLGLPSMMGHRSLECPLPRNFYDNESFNESCTTLPAALPLSEPTQVSFLIAKAKLAFGFARAVKEINRGEQVRWERILEIDRELRLIYENVPSHYKLGQVSSQESLILMSARFVLSSILHKSLCVVHSRFLEIAKSDYKYLYSRRVCLTSAMSLLRYQAIQNQEMWVDGRLRSLTNYQTSLAIHDYLLAATIISVDLCSDESVANPQMLNGIPTRSERIRALDTSARIFSQMRNQSMEAYKAADVLGMLLKKFEAKGDDTAQNCKNPQAFQQAARTAESDLMSGSIPSQQQKFPQPISIPVERTAQSEIRNPSINPTLFSEWPGPQESALCAQISQKCSELEPAGSWEIPDDIGFLTTTSDSGNSIFDPSETVNPASYSAVLSLNDPVSTLWNLNAWTQADSS